MTLKMESVDCYDKEKLSKFEVKFVASLMGHGPCFLFHQVAVRIWPKVRVVKRILSTTMMDGRDLSKSMIVIWIVISGQIVSSSFSDMTTRCPCIRRWC